MMRFWILPALVAVAVTGGCSPKQQTAPPPPVSPKTPSPPLADAAVLAGFETSARGWQVRMDGQAASPAFLVVKGSASRGKGYLHFPNVKVPKDTTVTMNVELPLAERNWLTSGDTARAAVRLKSLGGGVLARLFVVGSDAKPHSSEPVPVTETWGRVEYPAGELLKDVTRIGVSFVIAGPFSGSLSLDDVRIGPPAPKEPVYMVVSGPFRSQSDADAFVTAQSAKGVQGSPVFEETWYAKLGAFGNRDEAVAEVSRLKASKIQATVLAR